MTWNRINYFVYSWYNDKFPLITGLSKLYGIIYLDTIHINNKFYFRKYMDFLLHSWLTSKKPLPICHYRQYIIELLRRSSHSFYSETKLLKYCIIENKYITQRREFNKHYVSFIINYFKFINLNPQLQWRYQIAFVFTGCLSCSDFHLMFKLHYTCTCICDWQHILKLFCWSYSSATDISSFLFSLNSVLSNIFKQEIIILIQKVSNVNREMILCFWKKVIIVCCF